MTRKLFAVLAACLFLTLLPSSAGAETTRTKCLEGATGNNVLAIGRHAIAFTRAEDVDGKVIVSCFFDEGRMRSFRPKAYSNTSMRLEGRYLAYASIAGGYETRVNVVDLIAGRTVTSAATIPRPYRERSGCKQHPWVEGLAVRANGSAAWTALNVLECNNRETARRYQLIGVVAPGAKARALKTSALMDGDSLTASTRDNRLQWTESGKRRTARFGSSASIRRSGPANAWNNRCVATAARYRPQQVTPQSIVFYKLRIDEQGTYGCLLSTQRPRLLFDAGGQVTLAGRYVAYFQADLSDYFQPTYGVAVADLSTGKVVTRGQVAHLPAGRCYQYLRGQTILLRADGAVAWSGVFGTSGCEPNDTAVQESREINTSPGPGEQPQTLDVGDTVDADSLALSSDRQTITWTNGGQQRSAPFGP